MVDEITAAAGALGIGLVVVSADGIRELRRTVRERYTPALWSGDIERNLIDADGIHDPNGWRLIADFVGSASTVMFFEESSDRLGVRFPNGKALTAVLGETTGFVFYLTDDELSYLVCFNFHEVLIGAGLARRWIAQVKDESWWPARMLIGTFRRDDEWRSGHREISTPRSRSYSCRMTR